MSLWTHSQGGSKVFPLGSPDVRRYFVARNPTPTLEHLFRVATSLSREKSRAVILLDPGFIVAP